LPSANAINRSSIESSLSTDSAIDIVSITAMGCISSFPLWEGSCCTVSTSVRSLLVVGRSSLSGIVMTRSITFGADAVGVMATAGDVGVLGVQTYVLGLGGF
jgi:hypothetical protein